MQCSIQVPGCRSTCELELRSSRGSIDNCFDRTLATSTLQPRVAAAFATCRHNVLSLCSTSLRIGSLDLYRSFLLFDSFVHAELPSFDACYSFTMIKAIFYSKFDTQEGKI